MLQKIISFWKRTHFAFSKQKGRLTYNAKIIGVHDKERKPQGKWFNPVQPSILIILPLTPGGQKYFHYELTKYMQAAAKSNC